MVSQAQRDWAARGRAAAAADPKKYASVRIESSVDRARKKTEKATEAVAATGRKYRGPTPAQVAAGTLKVGTPTTEHRKAARRAARRRTTPLPIAKDLPTIRTKKPTDVQVTDEYRGPTPAQIAAGTLEVGVPTTKHREETRKVVITKDLPTIHAKKPIDVLGTTDKYRGPTPAQIAAGTLEVEPPTTVHRVKARAAALLKPEIKTGEIPQELVALKTREKTLELMEKELSPDVHPIVKDEYKGTREEYQEYQKQFGEYETEYKDYLKEYERVESIYETRQKAAEDLKRDEIIPTIPEGIHAVQPTILIHGKTPADYGKDIQIYRDPSLKEIEAAISKKIPKFESLVSRSVEVVEKYPKISETLISARETMYATPRRELSSEIISAFGEGIYTHVQEKPVETAAYVAAGYAAAPLIGAIAPAVRILPYGAQVTRAASTIGKIPYVGYAARKAPGAAMFSLFGATEYQRITQPVLTVEYTKDGEGIPIMREPTYPEMAGRLGETAVVGEAMLVGAGLYKYGAVGISKIKSLPKVPYTISRKATLPEGVLLKGKIPVVPEIKPSIPTTKLVKYEAPKVETYIGKIKDDVAELYVKIPETELGILSRITSKKVPRTIITKEGKFMVIEEPKYLEFAPPSPKLLAGEPKITLREKVTGIIPYEIIKKVDIKPVKLEITTLPERMMIPEFTTTIDVTPMYRPVTWGKYLEGTREMLKVGETRVPIDITKPLIRKDIVEVPYTRDISIGIGEESAILGRVLSKTERAMVRDVITKERIEFEPLKIVTPPKSPTVFDSVDDVSVGIGMQQIVKPKMAPVALKEKVEIPTIDLSKDLLMPQRMAEIVTKPKMAPVALKEKVEIPTIDLEALFKRPTYEQVMAKRLVTTKEAVKPKFTPIAFGARVKPIHEIKVIDTVIHKAIPSEKEDIAKKIAIFGVSLPKTKVDMVTQFKIAPVDKTLVKPELYKPPPPPKVTVAKPPIKPILPIRLKKEDKKDKKKKARKVKEFEVLYTNPIASPFAVPSTGKIKKNK